VSVFSPAHFYRRVTDIDLDALGAAGVEAVLVDIDNTIVPRDTGELGDDLRAWVEALKTRGLEVCLVSNNWHDHVKSFADALGVHMVAKALKPLPYGFRKASRMLGKPPRAIAVIGDQIFTDILGGNLAGMTTVLVLPLSETDLVHTLALRKIERRIMAGRSPLP
jgi:uncharacterized protein